MSASAHVDCPLICLPALEDYANALVTRNQLEVCPLSRWVTSVILHPYPDHYSPAFAFSSLLYPPTQQCSSRSTCPRADRRAYPVPQFQQNGQVPSLRRGSLSSACSLVRRETPYPIAFALSLSASLAGLYAHDACKGSLSLTVLHSSQAQLSA